MNTCLEQFESLSAWVDGQATPEESATIKSHLATCAHCREVVATLRGLPAQLQSASESALGGDFANRTAARIRAQRPQTGLRSALWQLSQNPVGHLVQSQRQRRYRFGSREMLAAAAIFFLPALFMSYLSESHSLLGFLMCSALGLMVGLPLRQFSEEVALFSALRRGRCLEEILAAGIDARSLLDGLAYQGFAQVARASFSVMPVLMLGSLALPLQWRQEALGVELAWLPLVLAFFVGGYYFALFVLVWQGKKVGLFMRMLGLLLPVALLGSSLGAVGLFGGLLLLAAASRTLALRCLAAQPEAVAGARNRNPLVRGLTQNPIARREFTRLSRSLAGRNRLASLVGWRLTSILLPTLWCVWVLGQPMPDWPGCYWLGAMAFTVLFFVRSAARCLGAVPREREQKTWEILIQSPLGLSTFGWGWVEVCLYTTFTEGVLSVAALGCVGLFSAVPSAYLAASCLGLLLAALVGCLVGLGLSASSRSTREAQQRFIGRLAVTAIAWLLCWGFLSAGPALLADDLYQQKLLYSLQYLYPYAALWVVGLGLCLFAQSQLKELRNLEPEPASSKAGYFATLLPLDLAGVLLLCCQSAALRALLKVGQLEPLQGTLLMLLVSVGWLLLVRLPLASLAELARGRWASAFLGTLFGATGLGIGLLALNLWKFSSLSLGLPVVLVVPLLVGVISGFHGARCQPVATERRGKLIWRAGLGLACLVAVLACLGTGFRQAAQQTASARDQLSSLAADRQRPSRGPSLTLQQFNQQFPEWPDPRCYPTSWEMVKWGRERLEAGHHQEAFLLGRLALSDASPAWPAPAVELLSAVPRDKVSATDIRELIAILQPDDVALTAYLQWTLDNMVLDTHYGIQYREDALAGTVLGLIDPRPAQLLQQRQRLQPVKLEQFARLGRSSRSALLQLPTDDDRNYFTHLATDQTRREGLALGLALELYRREHGHWPAALSQAEGYLRRPARTYLMGDSAFHYEIEGGKRRIRTRRLVLWKE